MGKRRILIVDDDREQQQALGLRLRASGYETVFACDCIQAIAAARKTQPDLVLLDIGLPGGDGHLVLERLKSMTGICAIPVVVLSAKDPAGHRERAFQAGAVAYFQKPADNTELLASIRDALGEPVQDREVA